MQPRTTGTLGMTDLRGRRDEILAIANRWGASEVRVFGSVARGQHRDTSDVDLLVRFEPGRSLLDQVHLIDDLRTLLRVEVDVIAEGGLLDRDGHILDEAVAL